MEVKTKVTVTRNSKLDTTLLTDKAQFTYSNKTKHAVASGTSTYRTNIATTTNESNALAIIGACLFKYKLSDWATMNSGLTAKERKTALMPALTARYAYGIIIKNNQQRDLQKRNIEAEIKRLSDEISILEQRKEQAKQWLSEHPDGADADHKPKKKEYNPLSYEEDCRLQRNKSKLERLHANDDWMDVTFGGKAKHRRIMRAIQRGDENAEDKLQKFLISRYSIYALGESTARYGNVTVIVTDDEHVRIRIPDEVQDAVAKAMGWEEQRTFLDIDMPVHFDYGNDVVVSNISQGLSTTNEIKFIDDRWVLITTINSDSAINRDTSEACKNGGAWTLDDGSRTFATGSDHPAVSARKAAQERRRAIERDIVSADIDREACAKRHARFAGIDVNANHIDVSICDAYGNPCGKPLTIPYAMYVDEKRTKSSILHALDRVKHICEYRHVECVFMEDLNGFLDSKSRVLNDGGRDFRRCVSSIPTGVFKEWAVRKLTTSSCHVEFVAAAYTSKCGKKFWSDLFSSVHHAAALMIARRGLGLGLFRRVPSGPLASRVKPSGCSDGCLSESESMSFDGGGLGSGGAVVGAGDVVLSAVSSERTDGKESHLNPSRVLRRRHVAHRVIPVLR